MTGETKDSFKLALAQANPVVGDIAGNLEKARGLRAYFGERGADLIVFTELYLTGYPLEDLVLKPALQRAAKEACEALAKETADGGPAVLMGLPVGRTRILVYTLNGFCAALAGVVATWYLASGNPAMGAGVELDAIASVVIGGTLLSGGVGGPGGTLMGVLIFGTIQAALMFDGRLTSWWLRIAVGTLLLVFILLQTWLAAKKNTHDEALHIHRSPACARCTSHCG